MSSTEPTPNSSEVPVPIDQALYNHAPRTPILTQIGEPAQSVSTEIISNLTDSSPAPVKILPASAEAPSFFKKWGSLVIMSLALAIIVIDTTLLNVSLGAIIKDLHTDLKSLQWVIAAYALVLTALTITGGRLGDLFGRKKMFVFGAIIFAAGSFLASISNSVGILLLGESIIEGIGAALMMPATSSLLVANFRGRERAIAFGVWGGIAAASSAIGPILGGFLTTHYSWRWGFRINIVVAAILIFGSVLIKESYDLEEKPQLDWGGILFSALGLLAVVYGIIESSTYGWFSAKKAFEIGNAAFDLGGISIVPFAIVIGFIFLGLFVLWEQAQEREGKTPLVSLYLFSNSQFTSGTLTTAVLSLSQAGIFFTLPVFLQAARGLNAFDTGLTLLPMSLALLFSAPLSIFLVKHIVPKHIIQIGLFTDVIAVIIIWRSLSPTASVWDLAPGLMLYGLGMGFVMAQISNLTLSAVSVEEAGEASGVNNTLRQLGSSLGAAIMGAVLLSSLSAGLINGIQASTVIPAQFKPQIQDAVAKHSEDFQFGDTSKLSAQGGQQLPSQVTSEISAISKVAITDANKKTALYSILFVLLGLLVSIRLPNIRNLERNQSVAAKH
jgi:EmrB/QacA subfamily drug resistance transporter